MKRILLFVMSVVLMCSTFSCSKKSSSSSEKKDIDPIQRKVEGSIYYNELAGFKFDGGDTWIYADLNSDSWKKLEELGIDNDIENRDLNAHAEAGGLFTVDVEKYSGEPMDWVKNKLASDDYFSFELSEGEKITLGDTEFLKVTTKATGVKDEGTLKGLKDYIDDQSFLASGIYYTACIDDYIVVITRLYGTEKTESDEEFESRFSTIG